VLFETGADFREESVSVENASVLVFWLVAKTSKERRRMSLNNEEGGVQMKKLIVCLAILAFVGYAQAADVLVGSFEGSNDGWADHPATAGTGWSATVYVDDPMVMPSRYAEFSSDWSTDGLKSLKANVTGWDWFPRHDVMSVWFDHDTIEFDIIAIAQEGSTATFAQVEKFAGSFQTNGWFDMAGSTFNTGVTGELATHVSYNYRAAGYAASTYANPTDAYGSIIIAFNADAPVWMYIDNVKFTGIPEPATISFLGLGGLSLLRRKR